MRRLTRPIELADLSLATKKVAGRLRVFVAGPYIKKDWTQEELGKQAPATRLRLKIKDYLENELMHEAVLGEHRGVAEMADKHLRSRATVVLSEVHAATDQCEAIIVLPSSPGSFCELGTWSVKENLCRKMLILGDNRFEPDPGYVGLGVFKLAEDSGSTVHWVDYENWDSVRNLTDDFIEKIEDGVLARSILNG